eukprot:1186506-Prorocentrum_minimum.AAC.2
MGTFRRFVGKVRNQSSDSFLLEVIKEANEAPDRPAVVIMDARRGDVFLKSTGIFSRRTHQTQKARVHFHDGPIRRRKHGHILTTDPSDAGVLARLSYAKAAPHRTAITQTVRCQTPVISNTPRGGLLVTSQEEEIYPARARHRSVICESPHAERLGSPGRQGTPRLYLIQGCEEVTDLYRGTVTLAGAGARAQLRRCLDTNPTRLSTNPTSLDTNPTSLDTNPTSLDTNPTSLSTNPTSLSTNPTRLSVCWRA